MKNISRHEYKKVKGWTFRIYRNRTPHTKLFSDGVYGGRELSLEAARCYRDEYLKTTPEKIKFRASDARSTTKIPGLSIGKVVKENIITYACWISCTSKNGQPKTEQLRPKGRRLFKSRAQLICTSSAEKLHAALSPT